MSEEYLEDEFCEVCGNLLCDDTFYVECYICDGSGSDEGKQCSLCEGTGETPCPECSV